MTYDWETIDRAVFKCLIDVGAKRTSRENIHWCKTLWNKNGFDIVDNSIIVIVDENKFLLFMQGSTLRQQNPKIIFMLNRVKNSLCI